MKERPILFSAPMVRAILQGQKTQTRRVVKPQPSDEFLPRVGVYAPTLIDRDGEVFPGAERFGASDDSEDYPCPYGQPGDRLWVRETCLIWKSKEGHLVYSDDGPTYQDDPEYDACMADGKILKAGGKTGYWQVVPSIHMPRWASRITLEITGVRVERLNNISESDAIAEGVDAITMADVPRQATWNRRHDFKQLWDPINAKKHPWSSNPWVWVIEFRRV